MKHVNVRLPDEVHAALAAMAEADRRSLNAMIVVLIEAEKRRELEQAQRALPPPMLKGEIELPPSPPGQTSSEEEGR